MKLFTVCNLDQYYYCEPWTCIALLSWLWLSFILTSVFCRCLYCFCIVDFNIWVRERLIKKLTWKIQICNHLQWGDFTASLSHCMLVAISGWRSALPTVCPEYGGMRGLMGLLLMVQIGCFPFFWTTSSFSWGWHSCAVVRVCAATRNPCNWECRISSDRKWMGRKRFGAEYTRRQWLIELFHALTDVILPKT